MESLEFLLIFLGTLQCIHGRTEPQVWGVAGVSGNIVSLPCFLRPRISGDATTLILWYKRGIKMPIYNHDSRVSSMESSLHPNVGQLYINDNSANLSLPAVSVNDAGVYECRVDFEQSPTHSSFVNLTIIEPPYSVTIVDKGSGPPRNGYVGPYLEGDSFVLSCLSRGGTPRPNITWWYDGEILHNTSPSMQSQSPLVVQSDLFIKNIKRDWNNKTLKCSAANSRLVNPVVASVSISMNLMPLAVFLEYKKPAYENQGLRLKCVSTGSYPASRISWTVRGIALPAEKELITNSGATTTSTLYLNVTREDNGSEVICIAKNPSVASKSVTNSTSLVVYYSPIAKAIFGRSLDPSSLREGDDVFFDCLVDANPPADFVNWYHQGSLVHQNSSHRIILSGNSLVLQQVHRSRTGRYRCSASNKIGKIMSPPVFLRLKYKPECQTTLTTYFIYSDPINVTCSVTSHPIASGFIWKWNTGNDIINSGPFKTSKHSHSKSDKAFSKLIVYPSKNPEDRELACWAKNSMGVQEEPCLFAIKVASDTLEPLSGCHLANITVSSLSLSCSQPEISVAGENAYNAEVYSENKTSLLNITSASPRFNIEGLESGTNYEIKVYASFGPVSSLPVVMSAYTTRTPKAETSSSAESRPETDKSNLVKVIISIAAGVVITCCLAAVIKIYWKKTRTRQFPNDDKEMNKLHVEDEHGEKSVETVFLYGSL